MTKNAKLKSKKIPKHIQQVHASRKTMILITLLVIGFGMTGAMVIYRGYALAPSTVSTQVAPMGGVSEYYLKSFPTKGTRVKFKNVSEQVYNSPLVWPTKGAVNVTNGWGDYVNISIDGVKKTGYHPGIDIWAEPGTPVYAAAKGVVIGKFDWGNCGRAYLIQRNTDPKTYLTYEHMAYDDPSNKNINDKVAKGDKIGSVGVYGLKGYCGSGTPPNAHLHFGVEKQGSITKYADSSSRSELESRTIDPTTLLPPAPTN